MKQDLVRLALQECTVLVVFSGLLNKPLLSSYKGKMFRQHTHKKKSLHCRKSFAIRAETNDSFALKINKKLFMKRYNFLVFFLPPGVVLGRKTGILRHDVIFWRMTSRVGSLAERLD